MKSRAYIMHLNVYSCRVRALYQSSVVQLIKILKTKILSTKNRPRSAVFFVLYTRTYTPGLNFFPLFV